jgi:hypothetical protein
VLLAAGLLSGLGFAHAIRERREADEKAKQTLATLEKLAWLLEHHDLGQTTVDIAPPRALGDAADPSGMRAVQEYLMGGHYLLDSDPDTVGSQFLRGELANDAWGRPIRYRCPGVRYKWDFSSLGANGQDEVGGGDDLVVGPETSR